MAADLTSFTIPGHKRRGHEVAAELGRFFDADIPLYGGLDTVKLDADVVGQAERLGAQLWGADWCRYSTGGSTHANQAVALAVGRPGDRVLVARNAHRSTLTGLVLAGLDPVWLPSSIDETLGVPTGLDLDARTPGSGRAPGCGGTVLRRARLSGDDQRPAGDHRGGPRARGPGRRRPGLGGPPRPSPRLSAARARSRRRRTGHERPQDVGRVEPGLGGGGSDRPARRRPARARLRGRLHDQPVRHHPGQCRRGPGPARRPRGPGAARPPDHLGRGGPGRSGRGGCPHARPVRPAARPL